MRSIKVLVLLVALALVAAGCGARLNKTQIAAATAGGGGNGTGASAGSAGGTGGAGADTGAGGTDSGAAGGAGGGTAGATGGAGGAGGGSGGGGAAAAPAGGNGGATDVGVTANQITLGNVSTLTGPVPGLFRGAVSGTQAFLAYQNSQGGVFGRQLKLKVGDDRLDEGEHRNQIVSLMPQVFAFVGSFSVYDDGGVDDMNKNNFPDIGYALSRNRGAMKTNFSIQPLPPGWREGPLNYYKQHFPDVIGKVGAIVGDIPSALQAWQGEKAAMQADGYTITYENKYEATQTDFTADVLRMRNAGVKMVVMTGDVGAMAHVAQAMQQQNFKVPLANWAANAYDPSFIQQGGPGTEGSLLDVQLAMYGGEDAGAIPEVALFNQWLKRVDPNAKPDIFAAYGWASARLFVQALIAAGPKATRAALLGALSKIDDFDDNGMIAPAGPASKRPPVCYMLVKVQGGKFVRADPPGKGFRCNDGPYYRIPGT